MKNYETIYTKTESNMISIQFPLLNKQISDIHVFGYVRLK